MHRTRFWMTLKTWVALPFLSLAIPSQADSDFNGDGLCDVWQQMFNAWDLSLEGDADNDGSSNLDESIAGTDPRNPADYLKIDKVHLAGSEVRIEMKTAKGKRYQLFSSRLSGSPWTEEGEAVTGTGIPMVFVAPYIAETHRQFYKVETNDQDTDSDGLTDWAEEITGTDPAIANSPGNASGGTASDAAVLASLRTLTLTQLPQQDEASEKEGRTASFRLLRDPAHSAVSLTLNFTTSNNPDATKGTASGNDFTLSVNHPQGAANGTGTGSVTIPAGASEMDIIVTPVTDAFPEVPERLTFNLHKPDLGPALTTLTATATIRDANAADLANRTLFVAYLSKEDGVETNASGLATALVEGDNDAAAISLNFSNLTSEQITGYLRIDSGLEILNTGTGQVSGKAWPIRAAFTHITDQSMLTALHAGNLYISITTATNPSGEIRGYFNRATGSTSFTYDPGLHDSPALGSDNWQAPTGEALERDIWRFLDQCTYGGTEALYQEVLAAVNAAIASGGTYLDGYEAWLDKQIDPAVTPNASLTQLVIAADNEEFVLRGNKPIWAGNDPQFAGESYAVTRDTYGFVTAISPTSNGTFNNNHPSYHNRRREMWTLAMGAKAQVRQRMTQALSEILVISEMDGTVQSRHYGAANYWDMLAEGAFGKYRDLLEKVTYSPMMGIYLSHIRNRAQYVSGSVTIQPDENYAREIMQLFSIGLVLRHPDGSLVLGQSGLPIPTYDNEDITELARVMTGLCTGARHQSVSVQRFNGLNFAASTVAAGSTIQIQGDTFTSFGEGGGDSWFQAPYIYPMKTLGRVSSTVYHDFGDKILLRGKQGETSIPGQLLTGKTDAQTHSMAAADLVLAHNTLAGNPASGTYNGHQNTAINISRWLIQRLTSSNPSSGYLYRVVDVYRSTNGNLGAVMKAILLDYEARSLQLADTSISQGRMKEPMVHFISIMRGLGAYSGLPLTALRDVPVPFSATDSMTLPNFTKTLSQQELEKYVPGATRFRFADSTGVLGQSPLRSPSVFNWFQPDYVVPGPMAEAGLYAPEMQVASETNIVNRINRLWTYTWMNLEGMAAQPGTDSGVDDLTQMTSSAAVKAKVATNPAAAGNFATTCTLTFTPSNWQTVQNVSVAAVDDAVREGPHTTTITHSATSTDTTYNASPLPSVNVTINDNDGAVGTVIVTESNSTTVVAENTPASAIADTYTLRLGSAPTAPVTIKVIPSAHVNVSPSAVTFTSSNWSLTQTITVTAIDDTYTGEVIHLGYIGHSITSTDPNYADASAPSVVAFVGDNESGSNGITVRHTDGTTEVTEGAGSDRFVVALNKLPTGTVTVSISTHARVTRSPPSLSFTTSNWWVPQVVTVTAVNDSLVNGSESFNLNLTSSGGSYSSTSTAAIIVNDNDGTPAGSLVITESGGSTTISEGAFSSANQDSYGVRLSKAPTANVTVTVAPLKHPRPMANHAKQMGYFVSDLPSGTSNAQSDRILFDYADIIALYKTAFTQNGGTTADGPANTAAHFAATLAVVNKFDLRWCGGLLKSQLPSLTLTDLTNAAVIHPRKSIVAGVLNGYATTRGSSSTSFNNEVRDRCRIAAYLVSFSPQSFNAK